MALIILTPLDFNCTKLKACAAMVQKTRKRHLQAATVLQFLKIYKDKVDLITHTMKGAYIRGNQISCVLKFVDSKLF